MESLRKTRGNAVNLLKEMIGLIYPPFCEICAVRLAQTEYHICNQCLGKIKVNSPPFCKYCSRHLSYERTSCGECIGERSYLKEVWSWGIYRDVLKKCLHLFKYKKRPYLINLFRKGLLEFSERTFAIKNIDIIVPVPLYSAKLKERSFNQSEVIAKIFSRHYRLGLEDSLSKIKWTKPQNQLTKCERQKNIKNTFIVKDKKRICGKKVLLVDDIFTTGSTLNECAKILLKAGAEIVYGFALARGL